MENKLPFISAIMPVYNGERYVSQAIESVFAQEYPSLELIITDDGSTDRTEEIIKSFADYPIIYQQQDNQGPSVARNAGLAIAKGELIAFIDADDMWPGRKLHSQLARLQGDPELQLVTGRIQYMTEAGAEMPDMIFEGPENTLVHVHLGSGLYRKEVFEQVGNFNPALRFSEDQDWFLRIREAGLKRLVMDEVTLLYRIHNENMTKKKEFHELQMMQVLRASIARRRAANKGQAKEMKQFSASDEKRIQEESKE